MLPSLLVVSKVILSGAIGLKATSDLPCSLEILDVEAWNPFKITACLPDMSSVPKRTGTQFEVDVRLTDQQSSARLECKGGPRKFAYIAKLEDGVIRWFLKKADAQLTATRKVSQSLATDSVLGKTEKLRLDGIKFYLERDRAVEVCRAIEAVFVNSQDNPAIKSEESASGGNEIPAVESSVDSCTVRSESGSVQGLACLTSPVDRQDAEPSQYTAEISVDANAGRVEITCTSGDGSPSFTYSTTSKDANIGYAFMEASNELQKKHKDKTSEFYGIPKVRIGNIKYYYDNRRAVAVCNRVASSGGVVLQKSEQLPEGWCAITSESGSVEGLLSCLSNPVTKADVDNSHYSATVTADMAHAGRITVACTGANGSPSFIYSTIPGPLIRHFLKPVSEAQTALINPASKLRLFKPMTVGGIQYLYDDNRAVGLCNRVAAPLITPASQEEAEEPIKKNSVSETQAIPPVDLDIKCMAGPDGSKLCSKRHTLRGNGCAYEFSLTIGEGMEFRPARNLFNDMVCWNSEMKKPSSSFAFVADIAITDQGKTYVIDCKADEVEFSYIVPSADRAVESFIKEKSLFRELKQSLGGGKLASFETVKVGGREFFVDKSLAAKEFCATVGDVARAVQIRVQQAVVEKVVVPGERALSPIEAEWDVDLVNSKECLEVHPSAGEETFTVHFCPSKQLLVRQGKDCEYALSGIFSKIDYGRESVETVKAIIQANIAAFNSCPDPLPCEKNACLYESHISRSRNNELVCQRKSFGHELMGMLVMSKKVSANACGGLMETFKTLQRAFVVPERVYIDPMNKAEIHVTGSEMILISSDKKCETHFTIPLHGTNWIFPTHQLTFDGIGKVIRDDDTATKITDLLQEIVTTWKYNTCLDPNADQVMGTRDGRESFLQEGRAQTAMSVEDVLYHNNVGKVTVQQDEKKITLTCHTTKEAGDSVFGTYTFDEGSLEGLERAFGRSFKLGRMIKGLTGKKSKVTKETRTRLCAHLYSREQEIQHGISGIEDALKANLASFNKKYHDDARKEGQGRK